MREETIAALIVESLASFATRRGADRRELLRRSGLTEQSFADPHGRLPLDRYRDLFVAAGALTSDPAIALHHAEAVDVTELSLGPTVAAASGSPMQVFEGLNRYARLGADVA